MNNKIFKYRTIFPFRIKRKLTQYDVPPVYLQIKNNSMTLCSLITISHRWDDVWPCYCSICTTDKRGKFPKKFNVNEHGIHNNPYRPTLTPNGLVEIKSNRPELFHFSGCSWGVNSRYQNVHTLGFKCDRASDLFIYFPLQCLRLPKSRNYIGKSLSLVILNLF